MAAMDVTLDPERRTVLSAMLARAPFDGWSRTALEQAGADVGVEPGALALLIPGGVVEVLELWAAVCDRDARDRLAAVDQTAMKVREKVAFGVRARLEAIGDEHREAARRGLARLALPDGAGAAARIGWRAADTVWRGIGDRSTDGNFYSKRVILSGVFAVVTPAWLNASGPADDTPWRVLDARIEDVMRFEKVKARLRSWTDNGPSLVDGLARLRYPRRPRSGLHGQR